MKNIWLLNHYASMEGRHTFFARELVERGYNVTLFASSFMHNNFKETKIYPSNSYSLYEETEDGYSRVWIKTPPYKRNNYKRFLNQIYFAIRGYMAGKKLKHSKPDVIVGSSVHPFTGLTAYKLSKKYGVPFIFEVRDLWPQTLIDLGVLKEKGLTVYLFRKLELFLYQRAVRIISVLPKGEDYITGLGIKKDKVVHIPNGIRLDWFDRKALSANDSFALKEYFNRHRGHLVFIYLGAMGIANGLDTVLKAAGLLQQKDPAVTEKIRFLMVGDGPEKESLTLMAKDLGIQNVDFLGYLEKDLVPFILDSADVALFHLADTPVFRYGVSSNKLFDYMAAAKPIIYAVNSCFNFAEAAKCGIAIPPDNPDEFAGAIIKMIEMPENDRINMGIKGRQYVKNNHEFSILTDRLIEVVEECIDL